MAYKKESLKQSLFTDGEEEAVAYQRLVKELSQESGEVWVDAIDPLSFNDKSESNTIPWAIEDNNDVLSEYIDDVSDFIDPEDINDLNW